MNLPPSFHPAVRAWFEGRFAGPTPAQERGWAAIAAGQDALITAPTGSGKTLAAFLAGIDALVQDAARGELEDRIHVLYVSPLKALSSDVQKNLEEPLAGIRAAASALGLEPPAIRTALRTGDTDGRARARLLKEAPHVLITTPESLYLMLTAARPRELLRGVRAVIVDEVHALMRDKRGSHLALSLARLDALCARPPQRVGLSATVFPIEDAARFLVGRADRACTIVDVGHQRSLDLAVEVPSTDLGAVASNEQWGEIYDRVASLVREHRTTLVFVNTRRMAERVAHHLGERLGEERVSAHHGSLSKERRLQVEQRLKAGDMQAIVATASLELGIDVGAVELVCQIGTPRAVTTFLQRIGRAGHGLGRTSRGRLFATSRDELVECATLVRATREGRLDRTFAPEAPLDVLAQQIVAECAARGEEACSEDELFRMARAAAPYASLERSVFDEVVAMLAEGPAPRLGRSGAYLHRDRIHGTVRARKAARLVALTNGGAIPDTADYRVVLDPDETFVGTVNEDWAIESSAGDVFVLGSHSWRIRRVESRAGVLRVSDAQGQPPSVPFWLGEAPSRTWELSEEVSRLREDVVARLDEALAGGPRPQPSPSRSPERVAARAWLAAACGLGEAAAAQVVDYVGAQRDALGVVPTMTDVVFERFFDDAGGMQLVVHAPFGGRVNRAFGLALRKRFCMTFDFELQAAATDDAVVLSMGTMHSFPLSDAFHFVRSADLEKTLRKAVVLAPMFEVRWRWNASRSLSVLRHQRGKKVPPFIQRMRSDDLLAAVFPAQVACQENARGPIEIPEHPLVDQTVHDCLHEAMDMVRLRELLERIEEGTIRVHARDTTEPSPFSHEILNAKPYAFLDDAPLEERRTRALSLRRVLPEHQRDLGALDPEAIARVVAEARPAPRDADELHDLLLGLVVAPLDEGILTHLEDLKRQGRAAIVRTPAGPLACTVEHTEAVRLLYPGTASSPAPSLPASWRSRLTTRDEAVLAAVRGHAEVLGPFVAEGLAKRLGLEAWEVESGAAKLESEGFLLRGRFTPGAAEDELCDRRLLARIHRMTLDRLRSEIEPVSAQDFMRYLFERHHLSPSARAGGHAGLRDAVGMLQGFEIAASAWEASILAPRVGGYRADWLDALCLGGEVSWARLSPRRSATNELGSTSRATPITLAFRSELGWLLAAVRGEAEASAVAESSSAVLAALGRRGALFLDDLATSTGLASDTLASALWDLVGRGLVTSDGFQPLRELLAGRSGASRGARRKRVVQGRWSLVERPDEAAMASDALADHVAAQLLVRYGVVFRDLIALESFTVPWRDVVRALRRREARGLVRGGRFVAGFIGEQYALPEAVDALRRVRRKERSGEIVRVRAADPLNLTGILLPGPRVPSHHGPWLTFRDGALAAVRSEPEAPRPRDAPPIELAR